MSFEGQNIYPGDEATPRQALVLADEYRRAADILLPTGRRGQPTSRAPYRLVAIQAIELYLNAFMLERGYPSTKVRGLGHNLAPRVQFAKANGLELRKSTIQHLHDLSERREYLVSRYGPELRGNESQLNRLAATLKEVAEKVSAMASQEQNRVI